MSDLDAAMQAAVESMDAGRQQRTTSSTAAPVRPRRDGGVTLVLDDHDLPPIRRTAHQHRTFSETLHHEYGPVVGTAWLALREALMFVVLFWVAAILGAFVLAEQATAPIVVTAALCLRGALALATLASPRSPARTR